MTAVLAAAVVAAAVIVVALRKPHPSPTDVALAPIDRSGAHGQVEMRGDGADRTMVVTTGLAPATPGTYYEVWLLREATGAMVPLGVLPNTGRARYTIPSRLVADFDAVDISLQPEDGSTVHSPTSVLRAYYG
jgi:anti-sigma-K factor RskA